MISHAILVVISGKSRAVASTVSLVPQDPQVGTFSTGVPLLPANVQIYQSLLQCLERFEESCF